MKKQNIINLVKYHTEQNNAAFVSEVSEIAREFDANGDYEVAQYLMDLVSNANVYIPQASYRNLQFLEKIEYSSNPLMLPNVIEEDVIGIARAIKNKTGMSKFLFHGAPGTGKTESAFQIARLLERDILSVPLEQLIDSRLGETSKNVTRLFDEINHLMYSKVIVIFDELDALVLNRSSANDLREMSRATSTFLRELDTLSDQIVVIATTNLFESFDKALLRRFDALVSFDRYSKEDLIEIADAMLTSGIKKAVNSSQDMRLFNKILNRLPEIPYPGDMKQIIKTSIAFSDETNKYDYLRKVYLALNGNPKNVDIQNLSEQGFTTREIEILARVPKSSVSRKLKGGTA
ncbi:MAG: AAA family ATPase [Lachnospiraceae bacterium]|nr:ATP-binding protein [uncultured Acetatifactor sp.]MCI8286871.1 AAA family ATPase [Lachnospiraceae bacterium]